MQSHGGHGLRGPWFSTDLKIFQQKCLLQNENGLALLGWLILWNSYKNQESFIKNQVYNELFF